VATGEDSMSLLEQINARNAKQAAGEKQALAADQAEQAKPDAVAQANQKRADHSQMFANSSDTTDMQEEQASDEEQRIYTELEVQVVDIINGPQGNAMFEVIKTAGDPVEGIGQAAHDIIKMIDQKNPDVDREILGALGESAVEQVVQAYEDIDPSVNLNEDQVAEAYSLGLQEWMKGHPDEVDPDMKEYLSGNPPSQL
jgi:hypothetical protein